MIVYPSQIPKPGIQNFQAHIAEIVAALDPVGIFCYGLRIRSAETSGCFLKEMVTICAIDFDLLIVTKALRKDQDHDLIDSINRTHEQQGTRCIAVIHCLSAVKEALEKESYFFVRVVRHGEMIYDTGIKQELLVHQSQTIPNRMSKVETIWEKEFSLSERFYETASECVVSSRHDVAVFLLHQSVELACIAVIRACLGYRPSTHNLRRLFSLLETLTQDVNNIFPRSTKDEEDLFTCLYRAYSKVRYKEGYQINGDTVVILLERVKDLRRTAMDLYKTSLNDLKLTSDE